MGEAFTKLRYDKRLSPRRDAGVALTIFHMVDENPDTFETVPTPRNAYTRARDILIRYRDQPLSFVDAVIFLTVDDRDNVSDVLTVDGRDFHAYQFQHRVHIDTPVV